MRIFLRQPISGPRKLPVFQKGYFPCETGAVLSVLLFIFSPWQRSQPHDLNITQGATQCGKPFGAVVGAWLEQANEKIQMYSILGAVENHV